MSRTRIPPTPERLRHAGGDAGRERIRPRGATATGRPRPAREVLRVRDGAPLDRLYARGVVGQRQFDAGELYRRHAYLAGLAATVTGQYRDRLDLGYGPGAGLPASQRQAEYRDLHRRARQALGRLGAIADAILIDELEPADAGRKLFGRNHKAQARAAATDCFKLALDTLVDWYGGPAS